MPTSDLETIVSGILKQETPITRQAWAMIDSLMLDAFQAAGVGWVRRRAYWWYLKSLMRSAVRRGRRLKEIETDLRKLYRRRRDEFYRSASLRRADNCFAKINDFLVGSSVLDLGAGNGLLGQAIAERTGMSVVLADVLDYRLTSLPVTLFPQGGRIPLEDDSVDTTLIYLVLHHADDPQHLLREAARITRQRIIVMEGYVEQPAIYLANCFFDWYFNRVVQGADINLPLNFLVRRQWQAVFESEGLTLVRTEVLGVDEPMAPEHHVLYVLDKAPVAASTATSGPEG
jgi:SAM-dependent methyltransferase